MDINKAIFILKEKIQQDVMESSLPVSVVKLVLKDLTLDIQSAENEYLKKLEEEENKKVLQEKE